MNDLLPLFAAIGVLGYVLLMRRLTRVAQPLRLELAERGESLLADPASPQRLRDLVEFEMKGAFGHGPWLLVALLVMPFAAVWFAASGKEPIGKQMNDRLRGQYDEFHDVATRLNFLNNPVLMTAVSVQIVLWFGVAILVAALAGKAANIVSAPTVMASVRARLHYSGG